MCSRKYKKDFLETSPYKPEEGMRQQEFPRFFIIFIKEAD
ncbi:unnamed protein product [marine sediment metagenome]|uniref:Uncharacterized protein n=1 Tax=marine sediment metagenome TaxID=412755 RepID=X1I1C1_9ZZZZ